MNNRKTAYQRHCRWFETISMAVGAVATLGGLYVTFALLATLG